MVPFFFFLTYNQHKRVFCISASLIFLPIVSFRLSIWARISWFSSKSKTYISYFSLKDNIIACSGINHSGKFPAVCSSKIAINRSIEPKVLYDHYRSM
jgi:hypothetical protein